MLKNSLPLTLAFGASVAIGGEVIQVSKTGLDTGKQKSWCEALWEYPTIYKEKEGLLREFRIIGRFHGDVYEIDSDVGHEQDWEVRRLRIGAVAKLAGNWEIKAEVKFEPQFNKAWYDGFTEFALAWKPAKEFEFKIGKIPMEWTYDGATSSNNLRTLERSNIANNLWFTEEYFTGASIAGKVKNWVYYGALASSDANEEFGDFNAGVIGVASVGYDFGKVLGAKRALLRLDYMAQSVHPNAINARPLEHVGAIVFDYDAGKWGFATELAGGLGEKGREGDLWGFMVMPWYKINDRLEVVARYTHMESDDPNTIRLNRYENRVSGGRGDRYDEIYAGLNYYICGHKLKFQTGLTYTMMEDSAGRGGDYNGWSWVTGVRFSF